MNSARTLDLLRDHESPNVTFIAPDRSWPIVWERARGCHVWDAEGRRYLDLTAAFGVAAAGHAAPAVVQAGRRQMGRLLHAMGDVHPHALKARLVRELSLLTFGRWNGSHGRVILGNSGFEAVEAALKTARLATGRPGILAFEGAYHGLGYGALNATHREHFRGPFRNQLRGFAHFLPFPEADPAPDPGALEASCRSAFQRHRPGAVLVEPIQARGGIRIPPPGFLPLLRRLCDEYGALLVLDEIYTGFGRTGRWFACEHAGVVPDLICLGKALTGGFPLSACVGRAALMETAWPPSDGEAIHTSTFLGHPVGCAMALAQITEIRRQRLPARAATLGKWLEAELNRMASRVGGAYQATARVCGLMAGLELRHASTRTRTRTQSKPGRPAGPEALAIVQRLLHQGFILLPEGPCGEVISLTPPLIIPEAALRRSLKALQAGLDALATAAAPPGPGPAPGAPPTAATANPHPGKNPPPAAEAASLGPRPPAASQARSISDRVS